MELYKYLRLENDEIRLLEIAPGQRAEPLRCKIVHRRLDRDLEYDAVSYCWGTPIFDQKLHIIPATESNSAASSSFRKLFKRRPARARDVYIKITSSLHSALTRIRQQRKAVNRFIWADAVCIDQSNIPERNLQVRLMRRIYGGALCTWIHLGEEAEDSYLIPDLVTRILNSGLVGTNLGVAITYNNLPPQGDRTWAALNALFRRPWFGRVWVMQEVALASKGVILCGSWDIPFDELAEAVRLDLHQSRETEEAKKAATSLGRAQFGGFTAIRRVIQQHGCANLLGLMRNARVGQASNPADYMYGVLGIAEHGDDVELQPDYGESVQATVRRFAKYLVLKEAGLEVISQVNRSTWRPGLPTWIPNWAAHNDTGTMWGKSIVPPFRTAGSSSFEMTLVDVAEMNAFWLVVKGVVVDVVGIVGVDHRPSRDTLGGPTISELSFDQMRRYLLEPDFLRRRGSFPSYYRSAAEWREATIKSLVATEDLSEPEGLEHFDYFDCFDILMQDIPQPQQMPQRMDYDRSVLSFVSEIFGAMDWSTLCITENGLLGRLPHGTQPGDFVCIFAGGKVPFVLRHRMDPEVGYMVLGPCYLNGIMNAEIADTLEGPALMDIVLN